MLLSGTESEADLKRYRRLWRLKRANEEFRSGGRYAKDPEKLEVSNFRPWYYGMNNSSAVKIGGHLNQVTRYGIRGVVPMESRSRHYDKITDFRSFKHMPRLYALNKLKNEHVDQLRDSPKTFPSFSRYVCGSKLKTYSPNNEFLDVDKFKKIKRLRSFQEKQNKSRIKLLKKHQKVYRQRELESKSVILNPQHVPPTYAKSCFPKRLTKTSSSSILFF